MAKQKGRPSPPGRTEVGPRTAMELLEFSASLERSELQIKRIGLQMAATGIAEIQAGYASKSNDVRNAITLVRNFAESVSAGFATAKAERDIELAKLGGEEGNNTTHLRG